MGADDGPGRTRRATLRAAGGLLAFTAGTPATATAADVSGNGGRDSTGSGEGGDREDFLWLGYGLWRRTRFRRHMLAFARRYGASVVFSQPPTNAPGVAETIRPALADASSAGVEPWLNLGVFRDTHSREFLRDRAVRERHLAGLREAASEVGRHVDGGRIVCWQEAPVIGRWTPDGEWTDESVQALRDHGPAVFEAQAAAIREANPALSVGPFVHFPYVVDSKRPDVYADLARRLRAGAQPPDFGFADFYRGWYEKDVGPDRADAAVRSLVRNVRDHLGTDAFYLGQAHTINPGHTPNRETIRSTLRAALGAGAAGVGWYLRGSYQPTTQGFDPFQPNVPGASFADEPVTTPTVAMARYQDAWSATLAARPGVERGDRFDCWLHGAGFDYAAHRVAVTSAVDGPRLLGPVGPYLDGDYPAADARTVVFRGLSRERLLADGELSLRIETEGDATPTTLASVVAMPWDPDAAVTASRATQLLAGSADVPAYELGRATVDRRLVPGEAVDIDLDVAPGRWSMTPLVEPEFAAAVSRLAVAELAPGFDPDARFDCWLVGQGLADPTAAPALRGREGGSVNPATAATVAVADDGVALYYGLDRERLLADGLALAGTGGAGTRVEAAYAMPYAGSAGFRSPATAGALIADQPTAAAIYAADHVSPGA